MKQHVVVFALGALTAFGAAGWVRSWQPVPVQPSYFQAPDGMLPQAYGASYAADPVVFEDEPIAAPAARPAVRRVTRRYSDEEERPILKQRTPEQREQERIEANERAREASSRETVVSQRSKQKSAAIIAGSAAAGAVIGGVAGGGKGAAIGAITGGAGGYVYDRVTRNKREPADVSNAGYRTSDSSVYDGERENDRLGTFTKVAGGAAAGAAIGGLAGGGKGAAIGAATGAAGGYVYDRLSKRR